MRITTKPVQVSRRGVVLGVFPRPLHAISGRPAIASREQCLDYAPQRPEERPQEQAFEGVAAPFYCNPAAKTPKDEPDEKPEKACKDQEFHGPSEKLSQKT